MLPARSVCGGRPYSDVVSRSRPLEWRRRERAVAEFEPSEPRAGKLTKDHDQRPAFSAVPWALDAVCGPPPRSAAGIVPDLDDTSAINVREPRRNGAWAQSARIPVHSDRWPAIGWRRTPDARSHRNAAVADAQRAVDRPPGPPETWLTSSGNGPVVRAELAPQRPRTSCQQPQRPNFPPARNSASCRKTFDRPAACSSWRPRSIRRK